MFCDVDETRWIRSKCMASRRVPEPPTYIQFMEHSLVGNHSKYQNTIEMGEVHECGLAKGRGASRISDALAAPSNTACRIQSNTAAALAGEHQTNLNAILMFDILSKKIISFEISKC